MVDKWREDQGNRKHMLEIEILNNVLAFIEKYHQICLQLVKHSV